MFTVEKVLSELADLPYTAEIYYTWVYIKAIMHCNL